MFPKGYSPLDDFGEGAIAKVIKAVDEKTNDIVAVKILKDITDAEDVARLSIEMESISLVRHPNIVSFLKHGKCPNGSPFVVMEWLKGVTLRDLLEEVYVLEELEIVEIVLQVLDAIVACHKKGVIHRDLKPENVMLVGPDEKQVKLIDFGMAKLLYDGINLTIDGQLFGTPQYLAPERITGESPTTKTDIYSLGIMVYEMATGDRPFDGESPQEIIMQHITANSETIPSMLSNVDISYKLKYLIKRMLRKQPEPRPTAEILRQEFRSHRQELVKKGRTGDAS
ncbi:serine/threonine protein kinase [Myxococcota bacterium]|nr:serine/threonine protein kinase [Myxococcota bacterium]MBU1536979.1 serine/threonine protein kinase [Myxococcota bacterium]